VKVARRIANAAGVGKAHSKRRVVRESVQVNIVERAVA
jgi:hypothetical protein